MSSVKERLLAIMEAETQRLHIQTVILGEPLSIDDARKLHVLAQVANEVQEPVAEDGSTAQFTDTELLEAAESQVSREPEPDDL